MRYLFLIFIFLSFSASAAYVDSFKVTLYKLAVSTATDCSNPQVVIDNGTLGKEVDLINYPEFGRGSISTGDYQCIAMEVNANFKFTPGSDNVYDVGNNGTHGTCANGVESTVNMGSNYAPITENYDYTANCSGQECLLDGATTGKVVLWFQTKDTAGTCPNGNNYPFINTASLGDACGGISIPNSLGVSSSGAGNFIVRFLDSSKAIDNTTPGECNLLDIVFDFQ